MSNTDRYSEALVLRVNELVHDFVGNEYRDEVESQMNLAEKGRWLALWQAHAPDPPRRVVDIGTGTGFVPLLLLPTLQKGDRVVCSDVSSAALLLARQEIEKRHPDAEVEYVHLSGETPFRLPFESASADVVTFNSVLHHLKETDFFLEEIDRVLRPGGLLFAGHEPNRRFRERTLLLGLFWTARFLFLPKEAITVILRRIGLYDRIVGFRRRGTDATQESISGYVNRHLLQEGLVDRPLKPSEIPAITDIRDEEGFYPDRLLPDYERLHLETYNHLLTVDANYSDNRMVQRLSSWARRRFPEEGATFFALFRKPEK